ncbi:amidohydrolase family protein [Pseudonocardia yunnanensis]|uniref:Amidohydrolase family protein n=1 Tax=Pseudonocardia yunnanensis TaxID=58107 RepID=A0ABW4EQZ1_9PSEU
MSALLIRPATLLTMNHARDVIADGAVLVKDRRIAYVGPAVGVPVDHNAEVIDAGGKLVMPGLVNCHTHLCMTLGRTIGVEQRLLDWLEIGMALMRATDQGALYLAELLGCLENLRNGNTTLVENFFFPRRPNEVPEETAFRAMRDSGVRAILARAHQSRNQAADFVESIDEQDRAVADLAARWHGAEDGRLRLSLGPLLPWVVDVEEMRRSRALADRLELGMHMHVAESPAFNRMIARHHPQPWRNVELLHRAGCLGPATQAAAVSDISDTEIELLAESRTPVVFDPQTRLFWGTGFPSIKPFLDAGLTCGLGTNGPAANCGQDLFESMKYACATAKTATDDPTALGRSRVLAMATIEGARAIGLDHEIGSLEVGKRADLITIDLSQPHLTPAADLEAALVYSARGSDVRDVVVDGRLILRDRRFQQIDEAALLRDVATAAVRSMRAADLDPVHIAAQANI